MARSDNGDDGIWKEIAEELHKDADRLFKMIGEAYTVLSDPTKVSKTDNCYTQSLLCIMSQVFQPPSPPKKEKKNKDNVDAEIIRVHNFS